MSANSPTSGRQSGVSCACAGITYLPLPTALGLADVSTLTFRVGTVACFPVQLLYNV